jgi:hypothetical protein
VSGYTQTTNEVLASTAQAGTTATYAAGTEQSLMGSLIPIAIPAFYFLNNQATSKTLKIKASGLITCISAVSWTWSVRIFTTNTFSAGLGILLGATPALVAPSTATLAPWFLEMDIAMRNVNSGATSVICAQGEVRSTTGLASPFGGPMPPTNTSPQISTYDNSLTYYVHITLASTSASASNLANLQMLKLYGEN